MLETKALKLRTFLELSRVDGSAELLAVNEVEPYLRNGWSCDGEVLSWRQLMERISVGQSVEVAYEVYGWGSKVVKIVLSDGTVYRRVEGG